LSPSSQPADEARRPPSRRRRIVLGAVVALLLAVGLFAVGEAALRVAGRVRTGAWPVTEAVARQRTLAQLARLFRPHPYLVVAPREGARIEIGGKSASFNAAGYRSPERPVAKPPGTLRVVVAGGSTTFDTLAPSDAESWPWLLEAELRRRDWPVEVWNAGLPTWTSAESLISLALRDLDLEPDVVVFYHGINDLQPAAFRPFERDYERGHPRLARAALGLLDRPPPPWRRSLLLAALAPPPAAAPPAAEGGGALPPAAIDTFARNVRSFAALAAAEGAATLLVTQPMRLRRGHLAADRRYLEEWLPGWQGSAAPGQLERLNDVLRAAPLELAADAPGTALADAAAAIDWRDEDFGDPVHNTRGGAAKLALFLADGVESALLAAGERPAAGGGAR
jgi:lysophospholipase L1-like esterase